MRIARSLALFLLIWGSSRGQNPVAAFTADKTSGCAALQISFQDQSTGNPKFWNWDFGNGQLSNVQNPTILYANPGTYTVTLVVRNENGADGITKTGYITVNPAPKAAFSADKTIACNPSVIQFQDLSDPVAGNIVSWSWDFGDGVTSTLQNPTHSYATTGFYDVSLIVTSSTGCRGLTNTARYIRIIPGVKADFINSNPATCLPPFPVSFTNQTSGPGNLSFNWDFGNGQTSTLTNPGTSYNAAGNYNVRLIAQSDFGCADTLQKSVPVLANPTTFSAPDSVCLNSPVKFVNTSPLNPLSVVWTFGDGNQSVLNNPTNTYISPGPYKVTLHSTYANCADSTSKTVFVYNNPVVDFSAPLMVGCKAPFTINFKDLSPDAVSWAWDFGDGGTSTQPNPAHSYAKFGSYTVTLTIISKKGCTGTLTKPGFITISGPQAVISPTGSGGCAPFTYTPVGNGFALDGVTGFLWNFGDGTTSTLQNPPPHVYPLPGVYPVSLSITTGSGCTVTDTLVGGVTVGTHSTPDFLSLQNNLCHSDSVHFQNLSTPAGIRSFWRFGRPADTSSLTNPAYRFSDTGLINVTLIVNNNGCLDSLTKPNYIHVLPPIANFNYSVNCAPGKLVSFRDTSIIDPALSPLTYLWKFGDPVPSTSTLQNPTFSYPLGVSTTYQVTLIVQDGACSDTIVKPVKIINEKADFSFKNPACVNTSTRFSAIYSNAANVSRYEWVINGGAPVTTVKSSLDTIFFLPGTYQVSLTLIDTNGCRSNTQQYPVVVTAPKAQFSVNNNGGCKNQPVSFLDGSVSPLGSIVKWTWDFGDGNIVSFPPALQPFSHVYTDTGTYKVKLWVTDNNGCMDSLSLPAAATVTRPQAFFRADTTLFCPGIAVPFRDSSTGAPLSYQWDFGDGGTGNTQNPAHPYPAADSSYTVRLVVTDNYQCSDTLTRNKYIVIRSPKAAFGVQDSASICPPLRTQFSFRGSNYQSFFWDFGDGGSSQLTNPAHFYNSYGSYTAKLYVRGNGGCLDSASSVINIYNPALISSIAYSPLTNCNTLLVDFSLVTPPSTRFFLNFGDGLVDSSQQQVLQHFYSSPSFYSPYLLVTDSQGCQSIITNPNKIKVLGAEPIYNADPRKFCDSGTVFFTNFTIGNDPVLSETWDFGDGSTFNTPTVQNTQHHYTAPGLYASSLTVTTQANCVRTLSDTIRVLPTPHPAISGPPAICLNQNINFTGNLQTPDTAITWNWDLGNGQTSSLQNPRTRYADTGDFKVSLIAGNSLGCRDTTFTNIHVYPTPNISVTGDTVVLVGTGINIPMSYSPNVTSYAWAPVTHLSCSDCASPYATPTATTTYQVTVTDANGCSASRNVTLIVLCNNKNFFVPNTFSPNGDGSNDRFYINGKGIDRINAIRIFNRWGQLVFEKRNFQVNDPMAGWDGTYKGKPAPMDTYVYMLEVICENGVTITYKGDITLIR